MKFLNDLTIMLFSRKIGEDQYGNKYYEDTKTYDGKRKKRYVRYNGLVEASKIPPVWHAWLHQVEKKPPKKIKKQYDWQKEHLPNLTGTIFASKPKGSLSKIGKREVTHADYESWKPK